MVWPDTRESDGEDGTLFYKVHRKETKTLNWKPLTAAVTISQTNGGIHFLVVIVIMYLRQNKGPRNGMMETCVNYNQIPSSHGPF